jgi:CRP/FNR family transcriptional regulator
MNPFFMNHPTATFSKGEIILHQDETPRYVYVVKSGVVEALNFTHSGDYRSISFDIEGAIIPVCWAFSKTKTSLFYYYAYTDCELYMMSKQEFQQKLETDCKFVKSVLDLEMKEYIGMSLQVDALSKTGAYTKILYMFRQFCLRYGKDIKNNLVKIQLPLTQQKIANFIGATRETTTMELNKMKKKKMIYSEHKYYYVNTELLNDIIDDEYNPGITLNVLYPQKLL